jgi:nucleoside 2-deoxyribosyltransferase
MKPKIYIAGPQVFLPDPLKFFDGVRRLCERKGVVPLIPFDPVIADTRDIFRLNIDLLKSCDGLVADVSPFRGAEPDSGTVWEAGFVSALGKPVALYTDETRSEGERQYRYFKQIGCNVHEYATLLPDGMMKNPHGRVINLMLTEGEHVTFVSTLELALEDARLMFEQRK